MFGTAISAVLIEYVRSGWKQQSKESSVDNKVATLETNTQMLLEKVEANNTRIAELSTVIVTQKTKIEDLNNKINTLDNRKNLRFATQASQTTEGRQIGKVIQPKSSSSSASSQASSDVTNSVLYQIAEETAAILMPFKKSQAPLIQPNIVERMRTFFEDNIEWIFKKNLFDWVNDNFSNFLYKIQNVILGKQRFIYDLLLTSYMVH